MEITDYIRVVRRYWRTVVLTLLVVLTIAAIATAVAPRQYRAQTELFVSTAGSDSVSDLAQGGSFTQRQVATYADLVTTPLVLDPAIDELGLDVTSAELANRTTAVVPPNTVLIGIAVEDRSPQSAADIANSIAAEFTEQVQELERAEAGGQSPVKATVVRPATAPSSPASPQPIRNLGLAFVLGTLLGAGLALLRDLIDTRIVGEADTRRVTEEPVIGAVAFDKDAGDHPIVNSLDGHSHRAEAFRSLRTNLRYIDADEPPRTLVMTSTIPGEGKSTTTANLAMTMAATGARVCLIEGDLRRPRLLDYLGLENAAGLTDVLVNRADLQDVMQPYIEGLDVLGCGPIPPNPSELLGSNAMSRLLGELRTSYDYVVIDSPPLLAVTDAAVLSTVADGTVVVVGAGLVKRDQLAKALQKLSQVDADVLGLVLNRLPVKGPDAYSYAYETYAPDSEEKGRGKRERSRAALRRSKA